MALKSLKSSLEIDLFASALKVRTFRFVFRTDAVCSFCNNLRSRCTLELAFSTPESELPKEKLSICGICVGGNHFAEEFNLPNSDMTVFKVLSQLF